MRIPRWMLVVVIAGLFSGAIAVPPVVAACNCCACDFGGGGIECGQGDTNCVECIELGGVPASDCSVCAESSECAGETLCAGDPQQCSDVAPTVAPAMSTGGLVLCVLLLAGVGALRMARRRANGNIS